MINRHQMVAFGAGITVAAIVAAASLSIRAQDKAADAIVACVGPDRVFRLGAIDRACARGEQRYVLSPAKPEIEEPKVVNSVNPPEPKVPSEARIATLEDQVQQLQRELVKSLEFKSTVTSPFEKRVVDLESRLARTADGGTRLRAPVEVVDSSGGRVARIYVASEGESLIEACRGSVCGASLETNSQGGLVRSSHESGRVLVGVSPDVPSAGVRVYGGSGPPKVEMSLNPASGNGYFHAGSTGGGWAQLAVATSGGYVAVSKVGGSPTGLSALSRDESGGPSTAELSGRNGRMALRINNPQGVQIAALGESPESPGSGALRIFNSAGRPQVNADALPSGGALSVFGASSKAPVAAITTDPKGGKGMLAIFNGPGIVIGALTQGETGGILQLSDTGGTPMVEAGTAPGGVGVVRAGPMAGRPGLPGIPGSFILGKKQ